MKMSKNTRVLYQIQFDLTVLDLAKLKVYFQSNESVIVIEVLRDNDYCSSLSSFLLYYILSVSPQDIDPIHKSLNYIPVYYEDLNWSLDGSFLRVYGYGHVSLKAEVNGEVISSIGRGFCVLVGICRDDTDKDLEYIAEKILKLKLFENGDGKKWCLNVVNKEYEILCVSQFTLYYKLKGTKLDFHNAMTAGLSEPFYNKFLQKLGSLYKPELIKDGKFGALMEVNIVNDGPVTIQLESPRPNIKTEADNINADELENT